MIYSPFLSIIVPIYGVEKYLVQCVQSILNQSFLDFEVILVNDGSMDSCSFICDTFAKKDQRVKVIHKENGGLVSARKAGLAISKGVYIGYVDGDDWIESEMYQELLKYAQKYEADIVIAGYTEELNGKITEVLYNNLDEGLYTDDRLSKELYPKMINTGIFSQFGIYSYLWNKIFKRNLIIPVQMDVDNNIFMAEDAACTYPAILKAKTIYVKHSAKYHYRQRFNSMVKSREINTLEITKYNLLYKHLRSKFRDSGFETLLFPQLDSFILSLLAVRCDMKYKLNMPENELFPFGQILKSSRLIVLGAGTFGQYLVNRLKMENQYRIVGWADSAYENNYIFGLKIQSINILLNLDFDFIIIAHIDQSVSEQKERDLLKKGIDSIRIRKPWIFKKINTNNILTKMGIVQ